MTGAVMTLLATADRTRAACGVHRLAALLGIALALTLPIGSAAQGNASGAASAPLPQASVSSRGATKPAAEQGTRWRDLKPFQQAALKPLEQDWPGIDASHKQKWLQLATRFPKMSAPEQARVQARMADWAKLSPQERGQARLNFQEATQLPSQDRRAQWDAYQALPPEQKRQLAARAAPASGAASAAVAGAVSAPNIARKPGAGELHPDRTDKAARDAALTKSNIVPNPALANRPSTVSPTIVRASPGATTTAISKRPMPPSHQQTGLPKIAATPEFVNRDTLLPKRGPQGAAIHPDAAPDPQRTRRQ